MASRVLHRRPDYEYPVLERAEGVYLYTRDGRRILDASGGALVVNIGHGVHEIVEAMAAQARRVSFGHGTQFATEALEKYSDELAAVAPVRDARAYLVSGGSEAVETALKLARLVWVARGEMGRYKVIARWGSYHGATLGALSASGRPSLRRPYAPLLIDMPHIPPAYCYRCPCGDGGAREGHGVEPNCGLGCAFTLEQEILRQGPETVAAFIAEPVVGAALCAAVPPDGYWPQIREICDRYGVLLIADEVMTGFGRTGRWFAVEHWGVKPDILVSAKGSSGGYYPLGVVLAGDLLVEDVRQGLGGFVHGFTHVNSVMGAAVGLAVLRYLQGHDLVQASASKGQVLLEKLAALRHLEVVGDVRGLGLMAGVELVCDRASRKPFARSLRFAEQVQAAALAMGVNVYVGTGIADGVDGDGILLGPPFVITEEEIDGVVAVLGSAIESVTSRVNARSAAR